ncbi:hypothetical protein BCL52_2033 [Salisediminibacterium halotolerans]|nr:hypothetical protein BCL39_2036 [Actinophytocola xinjiangensis]RPE86701.1 hypothetical protein EDD67_2159 [Salisediminibacterium halotolerans]TWG34076.1 hypothetical protein BCL52_2033 [Salisediminibacterium halotolerans]GEL07591.1 hypothetical protein SHA02_10070 [Salisediminibacterium halotolerans]
MIKSSEREQSSAIKRNSAIISVQFFLNVLFVTYALYIPFDIQTYNLYSKKGRKMATVFTTMHLKSLSFGFYLFKNG